MIKKSIWLFLATAVMATGAGCAKDGAAAMSRSDAEHLKNEKTKSEMIKDQPLTAESHFAAAQVAETQGDGARAIEQYQAALKLNPKHADSLFRLGLIYTSQQQYTAAIETWNRYINATGKSATGYSNLGLCLELASRSEEAEAAYKTGIGHEPKNESCRVNYGLMLARHDRMNEAVAQLQEVLTPAEVNYNIASVFESEGKTDQAKESYRVALKLDPDMNDAKSRLASLNGD